MARCPDAAGAEPINATDVDLPRIVVGGAPSGNACDKPPAAAEVARYDTVVPASGSGSGGAASGGGSADSAALRSVARDLGPASNHIATGEVFARGNVGAGLGSVIGSALPATIQNLAAPDQADTVAQPGALPGSDIFELIAVPNRCLQNHPDASPGDRAAAENVIIDMQNVLEGR